MEGLLTNYYEYHFLYINGIHHVESQEHPGHRPDEAVLPPRHRHGPGDGRDGRLRQPLARLHAAGHRARRSSCASTPAACRSATSCSRARPRSIGEIQDQALFKVRPMFASLPGVSAPPPFGGNQRTVVVRVDPDRLRSYHLSPDDVINGPDRRQHDQPLRQRPHRRRDADRAGQLAGQAGQGAGDDPAPARRRTPPSTSATSPPSRTPPTSPPATPWSTAAGPSTSSSPSGPTPRRSSVVNNVKAALPKHAGGPARRHQGQLRVRPVAVRHPLDAGASATEGAARRRSSTGLMVLAVPARLAERDRRRAEHPARPAAARSSPCG